MNKKILLGSIIAVVILVLVSFTGVVGHQTIKSSAIAKASPLFNIRTSRAIGQGEKDISTDYLGHGEETNIQFSSRMKRAELAQKAVNIVSKMDDKAFSRFVARIILNLKYQEQMTDKETSDALQALQYIRRNPNVIKYYDTKKNLKDITNEYFTCYESPGCIINMILDFLFRILMDILVDIFGNFLHSLGLYSMGTCCYPYP